MQMEKKYLFLIAGFVIVCSLLLIYLISRKKKATTHGDMNKPTP